MFNLMYYFILFLITITCSCTSNHTDMPTQAMLNTQSSSNVKITNGRWIEVPNAPTHRERHNDIWMLNDSIGWIVNGSGDVYKTHNGGMEWKLIFQKEYTHFRSVLFVDSLRGFAGNIGTDVTAGALDTIPLYQSNDGGYSWTPVQIQGKTVKGLCNFYQYNDKVIFGTGRMGGGGFFIKTTDGGKTWNAWDFSNQIGLAIDCFFTSEQEGFIFGGTDSLVRNSKPAIWKTQNGGKKWKKIYEQASTTSATCWKVHFPTPNIGYVSVLDHKNNATFIKTIDAGHTWTTHSLANTHYASKGVFFINEQQGWIGGDKDKNTLYTQDGGNTWATDSILGTSINRFRQTKKRILAIGNRIYYFNY